MKEPDYLSDLIRKHLQGEKLNPGEKDTFQKWREENENAYDQYKRIWSESPQLILNKEVDVHAQWESWSVKRDRNRKVVWWYAAAVVVLLIVSGILFFDRSKPVIYAVGPHDKPEMVVLKDSSKVWLNSNSKLIVETDFNKEKRTVRLIGEAYFEVSHQKEKPFIVYNELSSIEVLGTKFNVISNDSINEVQLIEGSIAFADREGEELILEPGEEAFATGTNQIVKSQFPSQNFLSWKTRKLTFDNQPIRILVADLEKHYGVEINLDNDQINHCFVTITFDHVTLEEALNELSFLLDIEYTISNDKVKIKGEGCDE